MERELRIFEMTEETNPTVLARSRLLHERLPQEYATTRARRAINLRSVPHGRDNLWSFIMLPDAPAVSGLPLLLRSLAMHWLLHEQRVTMDAAQSDPPTPRARTAARAV
jgi:hypothetical protein